MAEGGLKPPSCNDFTIIETIESGQYLKSSFDDEVRIKIEEFSHWFNSLARLQFLHCDPKNSEVCTYLLLNLKKSIKNALCDLGRGAESNKQGELVCNVCKEGDIWGCLQSHINRDHRRQLSDNNRAVSSSDPSTDSSCSETTENFNNNNNCSVSNRIVTPQQQLTDALNSFRFNFKIKYDDKVEEAFYPETLVKAAQRNDTIQEYTIQRCSPSRGVCLLCCCCLVGPAKNKLKAFVISNHTIGQKHLRFSLDPYHMTALKSYHEFWLAQEPSYQAHQCHFLPEVQAYSVCRCQLCQEYVSYTSALKHIQGKGHRTKILKLFVQSSESGLRNVDDFFLLDMQVAIYEGVDLSALKPKAGVQEPLLAKKDNNMSNGQHLNEEKDKDPKCQIIKSIPDPEFDLPERYKQHCKFFVKTNNCQLIQCNICKVTVNGTADILQHIFDAKHNTAASLPVRKYKYFCEICNQHFKSEAAWGVHFQPPNRQHEKIPPTRLGSVAEYECRVCLEVIFGDELSLTRHISSRSRARKRHEIKLPIAVKASFKTPEDIEAIGAGLLQEANQVLVNQMSRAMEVCEDLQVVLTPLYPLCRAYPFGSRISGLGNDQSDLDIFMDLGNMYTGVRFQDPISQSEFVRTTSKVLRSRKEDYRNVFPVAGARTPIVKVRHISATDLDCDISFRHGLGVENTRFLRFCMVMQPVTQPFILLLKKWSDWCKVNEHITNYGLALLAIFFLQVKGFLLSVKKIRECNASSDPPQIIDGWETINYIVPLELMKEHVVPYTGNLKPLLRDFFHYYSHFDYNTLVVCPLLGTTIPKSLFVDNNGSNLPPEMHSYVLRTQGKDPLEKFRANTNFCVQDPFDLSHNLTKACQSGTVAKFKTLCTLTYEFLDSIDKN